MRIRIVPLSDEPSEEPRTALRKKAVLKKELSWAPRAAGAQSQSRGAKNLSLVV